MSFTGPELSQGEIPDDLVARVKPELRPGERLVWAGRPIRRPPLSLISIGWAGGCLGILYLLTAIFLSIYFKAFVTSSPTTEPYAILGTIFASLASLATIAWIVGGINDYFDRQRVTRESYALTNQRALIWIPGDTRNAVEFYAHDRGHFDRIHRVQRPDGSGDLSFASSLNRFNPGPRQFREIADVKRVEALARQYVIHEIDEDEKHTTPDPSSIRRDIET